MSSADTTPGSVPGSVLAGSQDHLAATLHALQTDHLPNLRPAAGDNLYRWMNLLQTAEGNQYAELIAELQHLYNAINHGEPNGPQVKQCLERLAGLTTQAASTGHPEVRGQLEQLSQALAAAAGQLA